MKSFFAAAMAALVCAVASAAEEPGAEVVVVFNSRMSESRDVATNYAALRHVPARQLVGLELPTGENMTRAEYREGLETPLLKFLETEKLFVFDSIGSNAAATLPPKLLSAKIRYAVLCYGVPLRILDNPGWTEPGMEKIAPELRGRNGAAVDSELTLLPRSRERLPLAGPLGNPCFGVTNAALLNPTNGVLMVARLDGPTAAIARGLTAKAMEAETNGLWGRAYFDLRGLTNGEFKKGDDWMRGAAGAARYAGFETIVDEKPETFSAGFPMSQIALYAGWYDGSASGPFARSSVEFMPGAFAYHLQSFSAHTLRSTTEYWCGPLLAKGATATMGCVDEPFLDGTPNIQVFMSRWLLLGFTFGEAACASQRAVSWETTVVGDPLYRPFGESAQARHEDLLRRQSKWVDWAELRRVNLYAAGGAAVSECVFDLENSALTPASAVLSEKLASMYQSQGKMDLALKTYRQAFGLNPTPQQAVRLTLAIGDGLVASGKEADALATYDDFLKRTPDYPDALMLYQKMKPLADKLGNTAESARYAAEIARLSPPPSK